MSRLVAFGCSYTYGHGLSDCSDGLDAGPNPSQHAWPALLANRLDRSVVNMGKPGAGNTEILWKILNFDFQPDDICVIMYSYFIRAEHYLYRYTDGVNVPVESIALHEEPVFTENNNIKNFLAMSHAAHYLKDNNIKSYAVVGPMPIAKTKKLFVWEQEVNIPDRIKIDNLDTDFSIFTYLLDKALDGAHPGPRTHKLIADALYEKIITNVLH